MENLKLNIDEIKGLISLREEYWEYILNTNCYAFALGLDVPENRIAKNAYQLGVIGSIAQSISIEQLKSLTFEERLFLDLDSLGIKHEDVFHNEKSDFELHCDYTDIYWIISLFSNGNSFHFMRKSYNGIWYHKLGYFAPIINYDFDKKIITNPQFANIGDYKLIKTYKLQYIENHY